MASPGPRPSFAWYDNLSQVPLCKAILREFDRRGHRPARPGPPSARSLSQAESKRLKRFARLGGPDVDDVRAFRDDMAPQSSLPETQPPAGTSQQRTRRASAYNPAFEQHLIDRGIFPCDYDHGDGTATSVRPSNLDEMQQMLARPRASLSPSSFTAEDFRGFERINSQARTEAKVMSTAFTTIIGRSDVANQQNVQFNNLAALTDADLAKAQPDFYDGCPPRAIRNSIRDRLGHDIVPSTNASNPVLPTFSAEVKGPKGDTSVSALQACYDAAFGARAVLKLRSYVDTETAVDGKAYTISAAYKGGAGGGFLTLYATHPVESAETDGGLDYYMTRVASFAMLNNAATFRQGAAAIRNAREWAEEERSLLVAAANAKALVSQSQPTSGATSQPTSDVQKGGSRSVSPPQSRAGSSARKRKRDSSSDAS